MLRQIDVVDEDDALLAHRRTEDSLPPSIELRHDDFLSVVDVRAGRKVDDVGHESFLGKSPNEAVCDERFARSARADHAQGQAFGECEVEEESLFDGFGSRDDEAVLLGRVLKQFQTQTFVSVNITCFVTMYVRLVNLLCK